MWCLLRQLFMLWTRCVACIAGCFFRSVKATAFDQIYCMQLAQNAVHGAMAGYTAFSAGVVNNRTVRRADTFLLMPTPDSNRDIADV